MQPRIEWVNGIEATRRWSPEWDALALAAPQRLPMLSHAWLDAYAEALMPARASLICGLAFDEHRLVGVLPLVVRARGRPGCTVHAASTPYHHHSAFGDLLADPRHAAALGPALLASAGRLPGLRLREIALRGVAATSPSAGAPGVPGLEVADMHVVRSLRSLGYYLPVRGSWQTYREGLSKNFRANLRKACNRLKATGMPEPRCEWLTGQQAEPRHLDTFLDLEASGWKGRAGSAMRQDPALRHFCRRLVENSYARAWLEWHFMRLDGETVAGHLAVRMGRALVLLKIAYDERYAKWSPGNLLFLATAQRAFDQGDTDEVNCLTDMAWHLNWKMEQREYFDVRLYPRTPVGVTLGLLPRIAAQALDAAAQKWPILGRIRDRVLRRVPA